MSEIFEMARLQKDISAFLKRYENERRRNRMRPYYEAMLAEMEELAAPKGLWQEFSLAQVADWQPLFTAETVAVVLAVCTLGTAVDERYEQLGQEDMVLAAIFDEIALAWIVAGTQDLHGKVRQQMAQRHLQAGPAYRPGIGRWPLTSQYAIFSLLQTDLIQVSLSDVAVMTPRISTSLIIPILDRG